MKKIKKEEWIYDKNGLRQINCFTFQNRKIYKKSFLSEKTGYFLLILLVILLAVIGGIAFWDSLFALMEV